MSRCWAGSWDKQTDGQKDRRITVLLNAPTIGWGIITRMDGPDYDIRLLLRSTCKIETSTQHYSSEPYLISSVISVRLFACPCVRPFVILSVCLSVCPINCPATNHPMLPAFDVTPMSAVISLLSAFPTQKFIFPVMHFACVQYVFFSSINCFSELRKYSAFLF